MKPLTLFISIILANAVSAQQSIDTIHAGDGQLNLDHLPLGKQQYLVYLVRDNQKRSIWLWERTTTRENRDGQPVIMIRQQWTTSDTGFNRRDLVSAVNAKTFTPIYHTSWNPRTGREAYNYTATEIVGADSVADISNKSFRQAISEPSFNWELDLETFPLLPLKEGKAFVINFYHPGSKGGPGWYNYSVTGSEKIAAINGEKIDCFKLSIDYGNNRGNSTWWLSKKTHEVLKMEEHFGNVTRYKIRLGVAE